MRPGGVGLCAALSLAAAVVVVATIRDGVEVEVEDEVGDEVVYGRLVVVCLDVPRLAWPWPSLLCSDLRCSSRLLAAHDADGTRYGRIRC